jgi:hypothetical protein
MTPQDVRMAQKAASRIIKTDNLHLIPVERGLYDVFHGEGFGNHGRYRNYKGRWYFVSGQPVRSPYDLPTL